MEYSPIRLLICAGGTGGGVYPALAVLQAMRDSDQELNDSRLLPPGFELSVMWVGTIGGMEEELVKRAGISYKTIPAAGVHGVGWRALPGNIAQLARGYRQSRRILREFRPHVLLFTGGYVAVPMALAGRRLCSVLYVPDIEPGLALRTISRFADRIAVTVDDSLDYFHGRTNVTVTGYPTRSGLKMWDTHEARRALGLTPSVPTLLVFGGSTGARSINQALLPALPELLPEMQIVHLTGKLDWEQIKLAKTELSDKLDPSLMGRYRAFPYLHEEMGAALTAADSVLSRAGASTLGEFPLFGLPAILVPYPHAWQYQKVNAEYLARRGAALIIEDSELSSRLLPVVRDLMRDEPRRKQMSQSMHSLAQPGAARSIARLLYDLAAEQACRGKSI